MNNFDENQFRRLNATDSVQPHSSRTLISIEDEGSRDNYTGGGKNAEILPALSGWMTKGGLRSIALEKRKDKISTDLIGSLAEPYRITNPEWFKEYLDVNGHVNEHFDPRLVEIVLFLLDRRELPTQEWKIPSDIATGLGVSTKTIATIAETHRNTHPEWFKKFKAKNNKLLEYYHVDLIRLIEIAVKAIKLPPVGWVTMGDIAKVSSTDFASAQAAADYLQSSFPDGHRSVQVGPTRKIEYYSQEFSAAIKLKLEKKDPAPPGWATVNAVAKQCKVAFDVVKKEADTFRTSNPEWFGLYLDTKNRTKEHLHPELIAILGLTLDKAAVKGFERNNTLAKRLKKSFSLVEKVAETFRESHPDSFKKYLGQEYYGPDLVILIETALKERGAAPEGWLRFGEVVKLFKIHPKKLRDFIKTQKDLHPDWFKKFVDTKHRLQDHFHPKLIELISISLDKGNHIQELQAREIEKQLIEFLKNIEQGSSSEAQQFRSLIRVLGAARSIDILFSLHPRFKDVPIETVNGLLSEYLGETMLMSASGNVSDLEALEALPKFEKSVEQEFKEALVETLKDHCYKYYVAQKRAGSKLSAHDLLDGYLSNLETELRSVQGASGKESNGKTLLDHPLVGDAVMTVLEYFQDIWKIELPERVAASLKDGREFPDLAQRMNIKEVRDEKRMLIADEMGMGKSASAILSHEAAVQKAKMEGHTLAPALILVPSNVLATWRRYLSSDNAKGGCFKAGMEPKIVEIESPTDFARVEGADYVIMTQERMNQRYQAISETKWSTIIVDEMHKLKSTDGVRSSLLRDIAQRQKSDDRLVLLSGTPVPNTVRDIAVALTLLYPDQFKDTEPGVLAAQIIRGDLVEIRKYLLPRMQAKSLAESVELPPLKERVLTCNLPPDDAMLYKTFVEEGDELDRLSKLHFLRKWLLDPSLVDQQPNTSHARKGEKARRLETRINRAFDEGATHIVVFVNDIVDGILRPSKDIHGSTALVERINLPADVKTAVIHGDVPQAERGVAQAAFQAGDGRWVLYVSGNTADVGVDYSAGDTTFFFNEPWTEYARQQQRSRVYRPGVQNAVTVESLVTEGTVEQGIHEYVQRKFHAVEKLLRGIPLTDIEKELLEKEETGGSDNILSSEIAEQYLSAWDRLMYLFSASREIGEKNFSRFVERHGKEYADLYKEFRARSFAGNVNRVCGAVVQAYSKGMDSGSDPKVLDAASGPEMLRRALPEDLAKCVTSMDLNSSMFGSASEGPTAVGGLASMPFEKESFDVLTASLCLHYTGFQPKKGVIDRVKSFEEMQRVLKVGGWAVLALTPGKSLKNPEQFKTVMGLMGFDLVEEFTGSVHTYDSAFQLPLMTLRKRENIDANEDLLSWTNKILEEYPEAFAFERGKRVGRHPRKMFGTCVIETTLQGNPTSLPIQVPMKEADQRIYEEEKRLMQQARNLKGIFREMKLIPPHALEQSKLSRVKMDNGSYALYSPFTTTQSGLLIGEGVWRNL